MVPEKRDEIAEAVKVNIRGVGGAVVGAEAVIHGGGKSAGVARRLHVYFRIADQHGFGGGGAELAKDRMRAERIGLFGFKAVAAINRTKIFRQAERF